MRKIINTLFTAIIVISSTMHAEMNAEDQEIICYDGQAASRAEKCYIDWILRYLRPIEFQAVVKLAHEVEDEIDGCFLPNLIKQGILEEDGSFCEHVQEIIVAMTRINDEGDAELIYPKEHRMRKKKKKKKWVNHYGS